MGEDGITAGTFWTMSPWRHLRMRMTFKPFFSFSIVEIGSFAGCCTVFRAYSREWCTWCNTAVRLRGRLSVSPPVSQFPSVSLLSLGLSWKSLPSFFLIVPDIILVTFIHPPFPLHVFFFPLLAPSGLLLHPPSPNPVHCSRVSAVIKMEHALGARHATLRVLQPSYSDTDRHQTVNNRQGLWGLRVGVWVCVCVCVCARGSQQIFPHKLFSLNRNNELKQDLLLISVFFRERGNWDGWYLEVGGAFQRDSGTDQPIASQGTELSQSVVRQD